MNAIGRRLANIEQRLNVKVVAADQRDPGLVEFFREVYRDEFVLEAVPMGISGADYMAALMKAIGTGDKCKLPIAHH